MAYNREELRWAWLLVVRSKYILVKGTAPAKTKPICAEMKINTFKPILSYTCLLKKNRGFSNFTYVTVAVNFTAFESVIVFRNTRRPGYVSKRAYSGPVRASCEQLHLLRLIGRVGAIRT